MEIQGNLPDSPCSSRSPCGCRCRHTPGCASSCPTRPPPRRHPCSPPSLYRPCSNHWCNTSWDRSGPGIRHRCRRIRARWRTWNPRCIPREIGDAPRIPAWTGADGSLEVRPATRARFCCKLVPLHLVNYWGGSLEGSLSAEWKVWLVERGGWIALTTWFRGIIERGG